MSTYEDLLRVIDGLPSGTVFNITEDWCVAQGLQVTSGLAKKFGRNFAPEYMKHNCKCNGKGSDNLHGYTKL